MADDFTYHISIWDDPVQYVCQLCLPGFRGTLAEVTQHLHDAHDREAIPTPGHEQLLALRTEAFTQAQVQATITVPEGSVTAEESHDG